MLEKVAILYGLPLGSFGEPPSNNPQGGGPSGGGAASSSGPPSNNPQGGPQGGGAQPAVLCVDVNLLSPEARAAVQAAGGRPPARWARPSRVAGIGSFGDLQLNSPLDDSTDPNLPRFVIDPKNFRGDLKTWIDWNTRATNPYKPSGQNVDTSGPQAENTSPTSGQIIDHVKSLTDDQLAAEYAAIMKSDNATDFGAFYRDEVKSRGVDLKTGKKAKPAWQNPIVILLGLGALAVVFGLVKLGSGSRSSGAAPAMAGLRGKKKGRSLVQRSPHAAHKGRWIVRYDIGENLIESADLAARRRGTFASARAAKAWIAANTV